MFILLDVRNCVAIKEKLKNLFFTSECNKKIPTPFVCEKRNITKSLGIYPMPSVS
jgi:hypothetical protein